MQTFKIYLLRIIGIIFVIQLYLPIVSYNLNFKVWYCWILLLATIPFFRIYMINKIFITSLIYLFIITILSINGNVDFKSIVIYNTIPILFSISYFNVITSFNDIFGIKLISLISIILIIITCLISINILIENPQAVRSIAGGLESSTSENNTTYLTKGCAGYDFFQGLVFIIPIIIALLKKTNTNIYLKYTYAISFLLILYSLFLSQITTAVIFIIILTFTSICYAHKTKKTIKNIAISTVIILFIFPIVISFITKKSSNDGLIYEEKFSSINTFFSKDGKDDNIDSRNKLYLYSWDSFFTNPIIGSTDQNKIGGHALIPDHLGLFGILGTLPLFIILYTQYKYTIKTINKYFYTYYTIAFISIIIYGILKNIMGTPFWFSVIFILPSMTHLNSFSRKNCQTTN